MRKRPETIADKARRLAIVSYSAIDAAGSINSSAGRCSVVDAVTEFGGAISTAGLVVLIGVAGYFVVQLVLLAISSRERAAPLDAAR